MNWLARLLVAVLCMLSGPADAGSSPQPLLRIEETRAVVELRADHPWKLRLLRRGERAELHFEGTTAPDPEKLATRLDGFLVGLERPPGANLWRMVLRRGVGVQSTCRGRSCRIELVRDLPPDIGLRIGRRPDGWRLVFEGAGAAAAEVDDRGGEIVVDFPTPLAAGLDGRLKGIPAIHRVLRRDRRIRLVLAPGWRATLLRLPPDRLVFDLSGAGARETVARSPARSPMVSAKEESASPPRAPPAGTAIGHQGAEQSTSSAAAEGSGHGPRTGAGEALKGAQAQGAGGRGEVLASDVSSAPARQAHAESAHDGKPRERIGKGGPAGVADPGPADLVLEVRDGPPPTLRLRWGREVGLAALRRGRRVMLLFDRPLGRLEADRAALARLFRPRARDFRIDRLPEATLVWFTQTTEEPFALRGGGTDWALVFGVRPGPRVRPPLVARDGVLLIGVGRTHRSFRDPIVGDPIEALTCARSGIALEDARRTVDLELLPSRVCVVWRPLRDDLEVVRTAAEWRITRPGGLRLARMVDTSTPRTSASRLRTAAKPAELPREPDASVGTIEGKVHGPETGVAGSDHVAGHGASEPVGEARKGERPDENGPLAGAGDADPAEPAPPHGEAAARAAASDAEMAGVPSADRGRTAAGPTQGAKASTSAEDAEAEPVLPPWRTPFGLRELADLDDGSLLRLRRAIRRTLADRPPAERDPLRLQLVRLRLAAALGPEAQVALGLLSAKGRRDPRARALAFAAATLAGDAATAGRLRELPAIREDPESALFRLLGAAAQGRWQEAGRLLEPAHRALRAYPRPLQERLGPVLLTTALQIGDPNKAFVWLDRLARLPLPRPERERLRFLEALAVARDGGEKEALAILGELEDRAGWRIALQAAFARIRLARDLGRLSEEAARIQLARLRPLWRGHPWEPAMLRLLGELQAETGRVEAALESWRELLARYPEVTEARDLPARMRELARRAIDPAAEPKLEPSEALDFLRRHAELFGSDRATLEALVRLAEALASSRPASALALLDAQLGRIRWADTDAWARLLRARLLDRLDRRAQALDLVSTLARTAPSPWREQARELALRLRAEDGDRAALEELARRLDDDPAARAIVLHGALERDDGALITRVVDSWLQKPPAQLDEVELTGLFRALAWLRRAGDRTRADQLLARLRERVRNESWQLRLSLLEPALPWPVTVDGVTRAARTELERSRQAAEQIRRDLAEPVVPAATDEASASPPEA